MKNYTRLGPVVLRIGIALVFIWFGTNQLTHPQMWTSFIPAWVTGLTSLSTLTLVHINGIFEIVFGALLALGICTRFVAFILALHILDITYIVGYGATGARDFGLSIAAIAVWLNGNDFLCLDRFICKKASNEETAL